MICPRCSASTRGRRLVGLFERDAVGGSTTEWRRRAAASDVGSRSRSC